jgi:hypothetical protein
VTRVVVGVDGTDASFEAHRWAMDEARVHGAAIDVVHAWTMPALGTTTVGGLVVDGLELEAAARLQLQHALALVDAGGLQQPVHAVLACGPAVSVLTEVARAPTSSWWARTAGEPSGVPCSAR